MRPGIWSSYFIDLVPEEMVTTFAGKGWYELELSNEHSAVLLDRGDPAGVGESFRAFARGQGVSFPQGHLWLSVDVATGDQARTIEQLKRWLDLYLALGVRAAVIHPGGNEMQAGGAPAEQILESQVRAFGSLADHVKGTDLVICLENMSRIGEFERITGIIQACGSESLGICLDTGHLHIAGGNQGQFIRNAGPLLKAVHVADNDGSADQHLMPYGHGTVEWSEVVAALKEIGYDGLFDFEIPGDSRCPLPVRLAKLDYLREVANYMTGPAMG